MDTQLSRQGFLKLSAASAGSLLTRPIKRWLPEDLLLTSTPGGVVRITVREIDVFKEPTSYSTITFRRFRDDLLPVFEELTTPGSFANAPRWYRVRGGYIHSMYTQRVDDQRLSKPFSWVPEEGWLGEVTVPFTQSYRSTLTYGWVMTYRLYYRSVHWVTAVEEGPDGTAWYRLSDELLPIHYHIPAKHMRMIEGEELIPISPEVPWEDKRIEVSLKDQILTAFEGETIVLQTLISSGIPNMEPVGGIPTRTPVGRFNVHSKMPSKHMGNGSLTNDIHAYELPGVPWVSFFDEHGVAFHGTYWHNNFGARMSHGCVNMTVEEAKWLYRWNLPESEPHEWVRVGYGTRVQVI